MAALLLAFPVLGSNLLSTGKPVIYYVTQNPISSYYGDPIASYLARRFPSYQVYAYYLQMDTGTSGTTGKYLLDVVVRDINRIVPKYVFVYNSGMVDALKKELVGIKVADFSLAKNDLDIQVEDPTKRLLKILEEFRYEYGRVHILTDSTNQSGRNARLYSRLLIANGLDPKKLDVIKLSNVKELEAKLRSLNSETKGVLINAMYVLKDQELSKFSYAVDLKRTVVRINRKHLDINNYLSRNENEALIFLIDTESAGEYFASSVTDIPLTQSEPIRFRVILNVKRMDALGLKDNYLRGISHVDALIND